MKNYSIILLIGIVGIFFGCQKSNSTAADTTTNAKVKTQEGKFQKLDPLAFKQKLESLSNEQLVDIRTPEEFGAGHLADAVNYDFYESYFETQLTQLKQDQPVMIYCKSGGRSGKTFAKLKGMGFKEVYDMKGGYDRWMKEVK